MGGRFRSGQPEPQSNSPEIRVSTAVIHLSFQVSLAQELHSRVVQDEMGLTFPLQANGECLNSGQSSSDLFALGQ